MHSYTMYGETEQELFENAKKHAIDTHGYTEESFKEVSKNYAHFKTLIKTV